GGGGAGAGAPQARGLTKRPFRENLLNLLQAQERALQCAILRVAHRQTVSGAGGLQNPLLRSPRPSGVPRYEDEAKHPPVRDRLRAGDLSRAPPSRAAPPSRRESLAG